MKKFSAVLILSVSIISLNAYADDGSGDLQKPVMVVPNKPVDVVTGIEAGAIVLRDGAEYGYYAMDVAGHWVFHKLDIAIEGVGRDAHIVARGLGPVLDSDGHDIAQGLKTTGNDIANPYRIHFQNMKNPDDQDLAHAVGDGVLATGQLVGEAGKNVGKGLGKAGVAVGKTVGESAVESYGDGHKPVDVVSALDDTGHFFGKIGAKIFKPIGHAAKVIDGHYVVPVKMENAEEKLAILQAIAAQESLDHPLQTESTPQLSSMMIDSDAQQKPANLPLMDVDRSPAVLPAATATTAK